MAGVLHQPSRSYVGGQVSSVNVVNIDEFCLHDLKEIILKLGYGVADLMYYHFLRPILGVDSGLHPLIVDPDVLELAKYVKDNKIILVYVEHGSTNPASSDKGPNVEETNDPFDDLNKILGDYANTGKEINGKEIIIHVGNNSIVENVVNCDMLYKIEGVGPMGNFKEVEVDTDNETEE
ncbi:hypothetical protein Tco_0689490 [Tanacetum coccineum]